MRIPTVATGRNWRTSRRMAKATGIIIVMGRWRLSYALHHIEENGLAKITNYGEYLEKFPPHARSQKFTRTRPGAARTESAAGKRTAVATRVVMADGIRNGAARCGRRSTGCAMRLRRSTKNAFAAISRCLGGAQRLHPCRARSFGRSA